MRPLLRDCLRGVCLTLDSRSRSIEFGRDPHHLIAFGSAITDPGLYEGCAQKGIRLVAEGDSEVISNASGNSIFRNYNLMLDMVADREDLEALVLLHQDAELVDADFCERVRRVLADPEVAIIGCAGAIDVRGIAWWAGTVTWASFIHRYYEMGGGDIEALSWDPETTPAYARSGEVEMIDGVLMVLSPWAVRNLRFDESLGQLHGYDFDICMQARVAGKKVVAEHLRVIHHHSLELMRGVDGWVEAHMKISEKWGHELPDVPGADWERRARRAEAEADASALLSLAADQIREAKAKEDLATVNELQGRVAELEGSLRSIRGGRSWRLTSPIRATGRFFRRRRNRDA
ncbi:MAG: hypothetical protein EXQ70_11210 [Solirubrobacterales bacterium]|nr:hypothetical protein [Solirubrobacterales bacterium]